VKTDETVTNGLPNGPLVPIDPSSKRMIASDRRQPKRWQGEAERAQDARACAPWYESLFLRFSVAFPRPTRNFDVLWETELEAGPLVD
tara:strand:+ start:118 stop:381 length:264 start_codon:yes stop_codon:yes gene_type:complete